jgi:hypothetical protein
MTQPKPIRDVRPGDRTESGITYISEPAEQPDGSWSVVIQYPSKCREVIDFDNGDADSEVVA